MQTLDKNQAGDFELVVDWYGGKKLLHSRSGQHPQETIHELLLLGASDLRLIALFLLQLCDLPNILWFPSLLFSLARVSFYQRALTDPNIGPESGFQAQASGKRLWDSYLCSELGKQLPVIHRRETANQIISCEYQGSWGSCSGELSGLGHKQIYRKWRNQKHRKGWLLIMTLLKFRLLTQGIKSTSRPSCDTTQRSC